MQHWTTLLPAMPPPMPQLLTFVSRVPLSLHSSSFLSPVAC